MSNLMVVRERPINCRLLGDRTAGGQESERLPRGAAARRITGGLDGRVRGVELAIVRRIRDSPSPGLPSASVFA
jgi:hypothetical protein